MNQPGLTHVWSQHANERTNALYVVKEEFRMPEIDWSQFVPDLIASIASGLFLSILAVAFAYFKSKRFGTWLNKLPVKFALGIKWLVERWYFFLPFCIVAILEAIAFRIFGDWKIAIFSFICYIIGLVSWLGKNRAIKAKKLMYMPIPLTGIGNSYLKNRFINLPAGDVGLGGVQFQLKQDSLIFDTDKQIRCYLPRDDGGKEIDCQLPKPVNGVKSVYFLINSGNSKGTYTNKSVGEIRLVFKDAPPIVVELVLGKNIREWCPGNLGDYVREISSPEVVASVWSGMSKNGANAVIDCLKISVYACMRGCFLEKIIIVHRSIPQPPDTMGVHFSVFGVSAEIEQVV